MRIIGYIEHPAMKITVFKMDNRFSVKFETGMHEQTYKFRAGESVHSMEDIQRMVDSGFQEAVLEIFKSMRLNSMEAQARHSQRPAADEFDQII